MPPRKRSQSNAMLYTLIAFIGLFIMATTFAVIYYVKAEDLKTKEAKARRQTEQLATSAEQQRLGTIVGTKEKLSWLGTMVDHFDNAIWLIAGTAPQSEVPVEIKFRMAAAKVKNSLALAEDYIDISGSDPNSVGLTHVIESLKTELDKAASQATAQENVITRQQQAYDDAMAATLAKEQELEAQKEDLQQRVNAIELDYKKLELLLEQTTEQRVDTYRKQLAQEQTARDQLNSELLKTQAQLDLTGQKMRRAQEELSLTKPPPDSNAPALIADGKVILVDFVTKVVHIDKGSDDHVYRGLTFAIHDRGAPIAKDGKGKAEIEVFDVGKTFSAARIINPNKRNPVMEGDSIANLIWDSDKENVFVVAGLFDLDNDGGTDRDALVKIKGLIEKWGGRVDGVVSVDTDFLVLGKKPSVLRKPTFEQLEIDPGAMDKYEASQRKRDYYQNVQAQAQALWIPVFTYDRFLNFIGYKGQVSRAGAF